MLLVVNSWSHFKGSGTTFSRQLYILGLRNVHGRRQIFLQNSRTIAVLIHHLGLLVLVYIVFAYDTLLDVKA